jgi:hypothetical protein
MRTAIAPRGAPAEVVEEPGAQQRACPWALPRPFPEHAHCIRLAVLAGRCPVMRRDCVKSVGRKGGRPGVGSNETRSGAEGTGEGVSTTDHASRAARLLNF